MPVTRFIVFVCLGDSLTVGYQSPNLYGGFVETPYTDMIELITRKKLQELGFKGYEVFFINKGINGDSTDGMLGRFRTSVEAEHPNYVIVWAGINDLYAGRESRQVMENLIKIYTRSFEIGSKPIACTLTPTQSDDSMNSRIRELNTQITEYCDNRGIRIVDLFAYLAKPDGRLNPQYSNDGVHLSFLGYNIVAHTIFDEVVSFILDEYINST